MVTLISPRSLFPPLSSKPTSKSSSFSKPVSSQSPKFAKPESPAPHKLVNRCQTVGRRRSMMMGGLLMSGLMLSEANLPTSAFALTSVFREYIDTFDGYSFKYPQNWIQVRGAGADIFFRDPIVLDENLSVEFSSPSSSKYKSLEDLGPPEEAGKKVLRQYLTEFMSTRLGVKRESNILTTSSRVADDGKLYYQVEVNIKSYANNNELAVMPQDRVARLEWDRRYLAVLGVENNRLYSLRLQTPEKVFLEEEKDLRRVMDSFRRMAGYESYVVVHNIAKRHNVGTLARSATAFGVTELILVGRRDFNAFGSHGSASHVRFRHFHSLIEARNYLKEEKECDICGVEIAEGAAQVNDHPFKGNTAFLLGNEGSGLSAKEYEICDFFVYIPQYGCGTASLNVTVAASIVLHHFGVWAGFSERVRDGSKFIVADKPVRQGRRNFCAGTEESIVEERKLRKESAENGFFDENGSETSSTDLLNGLFLDE
ncbi:hypothetical protein HID58_042269 [Brassica napus]|uniref:Uncharacterized protein n=4 Tax=Brassica TaxID=3705 RepID=A0ABQ8BEW9_BRANA|nr:hypothetical protein HID58_042269 [Brassica napus]